MHMQHVPQVNDRPGCCSGRKWFAGTRSSRWDKLTITGRDLESLRGSAVNVTAFESGPWLAKTFSFRKGHGSCWGVGLDD